MLTDDMIKDDSWREELDKSFGWMGGEHGLYFECMGGWRFILKDMLERIDATLTDPEDRDRLPHQPGEGEVRRAQVLSQRRRPHRPHRRSGRSGVRHHLRRLRRTRPDAGQGLDFGPVRGAHGLEGLTSCGFGFSRTCISSFSTKSRCRSPTRTSASWRATSRRRWKPRSRGPSTGSRSTCPSSSCRATTSSTATASSAASTEG